MCRSQRAPKLGLCLFPGTERNGAGIFRKCVITGTAIASTYLHHSLNLARRRAMPGQLITYARKRELGHVRVRVPVNLGARRFRAVAVGLGPDSRRPLLRPRR